LFARYTEILVIFKCPWLSKNSAAWTLLLKGTGEVNLKTGHAQLQGRVLAD
jgi:hypothetical protein